MSSNYDPPSAYDVLGALQKLVRAKVAAPWRPGETRGSDTVFLVRAHPFTDTRYGEVAQVNVDTDDRPRFTAHIGDDPLSSNTEKPGLWETPEAAKAAVDARLRSDGVILLTPDKDGRPTVKDIALIYDPEYGDDRECVCGHPYYRHFDTYDGMRPVGCKYCCFEECTEFKEKTP